MMSKRISRKIKAIGATLSGLSIICGWFGLKPPPPTKQEFATQLEQLLGKPPTQHGTHNQLSLRSPNIHRNQHRNGARRCQQLELNPTIRHKPLPGRNCSAAKQKSGPKKRR